MPPSLATTGERRVVGAEAISISTRVRKGQNRAQGQSPSIPLATNATNHAASWSDTGRPTTDRPRRAHDPVTRYTFTKQARVLLEQDEQAKQVREDSRACM